MHELQPERVCSPAANPGLSSLPWPPVPVWASLPMPQSHSILLYSQKSPQRSTFSDRFGAQFASAITVAISLNVSPLQIAWARTCYLDRQLTHAIAQANGLKVCHHCTLFIHFRSRYRPPALQKPEDKRCCQEGGRIIITQQSPKKKSRETRQLKKIMSM